MASFGRIVRRIEKLLELRIGHGILVDEEGRDLHRVLVEAARRVLPWILHVDARRCAALNLHALQP